MKKSIFILLTILWMGFIFYMSHQPAEISAVQSNKIIHIIKKNLKNEELKNKVNSFNIRKGAHIFLSFVIGILFFSSIYNGKNLLKSMFIALLLSLICACTDEYHQTFISGRSGELRDILFDFSGAFIGVSIASLIAKIFRL